eukprot:scaffold288039_cov33-Prasinocladus_malaysianus.AAC.1
MEIQPQSFAIGEQILPYMSASRSPAFAPPCRMFHGHTSFHDGFGLHINHFQVRKLLMHFMLLTTLVIANHDAAHCDYQPMLQQSTDKLISFERHTWWLAIANTNSMLIRDQSLISKI